MYLDKAHTLTEDEKNRFRQVLSRFYKDVQREVGGEKRVPPQLRSTFLILTYFKAWRELHEIYGILDGFSFSDTIRDFEAERTDNSQDVPWVNFNAALSNAGYAQNRSKQRHEILMSYILRREPSFIPKDKKRNFTEEQKIAIWDRAGHQCEWQEEGGGSRCPELFPNFRDADADHIVKCSQTGPTTVENGRLLCKHHNRAHRA